MEVSWDGPDPKDTRACPYSVDFQSKPAPAESLNSLESGRLILTINLSAGVDAVAARLVNNAKKENLDKVQGDSRLKYQTTILTDLAQDRQNTWTGILKIPVSWMEGRTKAYGRTEAASHSGGTEDLFTLEITYRAGDNSCTARFGSGDAFHWAARPHAIT